MSAALRSAATLGPYFTWEPWDGDAAWRPLDDLLDPEVLGERVEVARRTLMRMSGLGRDEIGEREVASITFLGLASRLLSPPLGAAVLTGTPVTARLWWRPVEGGPIPFAYAEAVDAPLTTDLVAPILEAYRRRFTLSTQVLWGNVASALGGAAGMIADQHRAHTTRAFALVAELLATPPLEGAADLVRPDPGKERAFLVRRNCCLYYRIPGGGTCGDCVLTPADVRSRSWQAVLSRH
ncbi:(2Fe-2S)-binding protein [Actinoplanes sp. NPDC049265]|uniref:(2Fe-2S)-binding protein n=1 Tax=Actinoplanes sp. NPDC049265 TaxID=3363902 RepID=UPI00372249DC